MTELILSSAFFGSALSLAAYFTGAWPRNTLSLPTFNPTLIVMAASGVLTQAVVSRKGGEKDE